MAGTHWETDWPSGMVHGRGCGSRCSNHEAGCLGQTPTLEAHPDPRAEVPGSRPSLGPDQESKLSCGALFQASGTQWNGLT